MGQPVTFGQRYNLTGGQYFSDEGYVDVFVDVVGADVAGADAHKVFVPTEVVDDVWDGRLELGLGRPTGAHIDIRTTQAEQRMQEMAIRQRYQLANVIQKLAPHLHHWDDSVLFGIDKLARDVGLAPAPQLPRDGRADLRVVHARGHRRPGHLRLRVRGPAPRALQGVT